MNRKSGYIRIMILCMILALISLMAGGCKQKESKIDDSGLKEITFCLDWTPNTNHTGVYVAAEKGYYEAEGLRVNIVQPPENGAVQMCASGEAQFAVDAQDTMAAALDSDEPLGISAVATVIQHNSSGVMSRAGDGIDTPAGLSGKTYSTWDSPIELAMIKHVVEKDGGDYDSIRKIPNNITDEPAALQAGQTDAVWVFEAWSVVNADVEKVDVDFWRFADIADELDYYTPVIIANNEFLENEPETAKAFMRATKKGYQYAIENPDEAAQILINGDTTGSLKGSEELVTKSQKWLAGESAAEKSGEWGEIDPERWDAFYSWLYENGLTENDLTGRGYSTDYLE